jgi:hypothetical protein
MKIITEEDMLKLGYTQAEIDEINADLEVEYELWTNGPLGKDPKHARKAPQEITDALHRALRRGNGV